VAPAKAARAVSGSPIETVMKAAQLNRLGGPEVLEIAIFRLHTPAPDQLALEQPH